VNISLNGESRKTSAANVSALIAELDLPPETLLVEHNATALLRSEWNHPLAEGDRLELLRVAAGG
jgi:thiazole synthase